MNRKMLGRLAITSLMLGVATVACTPNANHTAAISEQTPKAQEVAAKQADRARDALSHSRGDTAVEAAENAVALVPNDAGYRMLLGQSYLAAGRFASAETSFKDTLTLKPDQAKARFDLALAQIAQGRGQEAQGSLHALNGAIPAADLGLALTLAGDHAAGIQMLIDAVRTPGATTRTRQNLALAFGLDGRWREARAVAMQDTSPDRINEQIQGWAAMAGPDAGPRQIAAMLGVTPTTDAGLPTRLALASPTVAPVGGEPPVAVAAAEPAPTVAPVGGEPPVAGAATEPALTVTRPASVTVAVAEPLPAMPAMVVKQETAGSVTVPLIETHVTVPAMPATPVLLAAAPKNPAATPPLLRAPKSPIRLAIAKAPDAPSGNFAVQLGAFAKAGAVQTAWSEVSRKSPTLSHYAPSHAQFRLASATFSRLSITGFKTRDAAQKLCGEIRARGGQCFVRATAGDAPLEWVRRDTATQVASL